MCHTQGTYQIVMSTPVLCLTVFLKVTFFRMSSKRGGRDRKMEYLSMEKINAMLILRIHALSPPEL